MNSLEKDPSNLIGKNIEFLLCKDSFWNFKDRSSIIQSNSSMNKYYKHQIEERTKVFLQKMRRNIEEYDKIILELNNKNINISEVEVINHFTKLNNELVINIKNVEYNFNNIDTTIKKRKWFKKDYVNMKLEISNELGKMNNSFYISIDSYLKVLNFFVNIQKIIEKYPDKTPKISFLMRLKEFKDKIDIVII
jgi:hypothetical protein